MLPFASATVSTATAPRSVAPTPGGPGFNTYDAPNGIIIGGTAQRQHEHDPVGVPLSFPNFSEVSYYNETEINTITS